MLNPGVNRVILPPEVLGEEAFLPLPSSCASRLFCTSTTPTSASVSPWLPALYLSLSSLLSHRTPAIGFSVLPKSRTSLVAQMVKHLPTVRDTWVRSLGQEKPPGEGNGTHSSSLAWKDPMDRGAW